ncbi:MAG: phosphonate-binding protein, partial [Brevundimonas sp.]
QSGEVDFLVATDAIGMGLNMEVDHVAFAGLRKFDGRRTRWLHAHEIGQIAGRAGRHLKDGTFGVTGESLELDPDLVEQVVEHRFDPVEAAEWRNARLDFDSLNDLLRSLVVTPNTRGLNLTALALDETLLRRLIKDEEVARVGRSRGAVMRLWEACQLPDFQKTTLDEHGRLAKDIFQALTGPRGRLTDDWVAPRFAELDRDDGQIDQLSARLSGVRTLSYIANRPDWIDQAQGWRDRTKALEERLSDVLHERLTARFVDRRTTALMQALNVRGDAVAQVEDDGAVVVEGHAVGRLSGVAFTLDKGSSALEDRTLRHAARQAVTPEIARRLGLLAADDDAAFGVTPDGAVLWKGQQAGVITGGDPFTPRVRLLGDLGAVAARDRATRRLEAWLAGEAGRALRPLKRLKSAVEGGTLKGLPRGIAFRLLETGGVLDRRDVERDLHALSQVERRTLKEFGIRLGAHSVWLPGLQKPRGRALMQAFLGAERWRPRAEGLSLLPDPPPSARLLSAFGLRAVDRFAAPVELLERLTELRAKNHGKLTEADLADVAVLESEAAFLFGKLKSTRAQQPDRPDKAPRIVKDSPFAALAALSPAAVAKPRRRRRGPARGLPKSA